MDWPRLALLSAVILLAAPARALILESSLDVLARELAEAARAKGFEGAELDVPPIALGPGLGDSAVGPAASGLLQHRLHRTGAFRVFEPGGSPEARREPPGPAGVAASTQTPPSPAVPPHLRALGTLHALGKSLLIHVRLVEASTGELVGSSVAELPAESAGLPVGRRRDGPRAEDGGPPLGGAAVPLFGGEKLGLAVVWDFTNLGFRPGGVTVLDGARVDPQDDSVWHAAPGIGVRCQLRERLRLEALHFPSKRLSMSSPVLTDVSIISNKLTIESRITSTRVGAAYLHPFSERLGGSLGGSLGLIEESGTGLVVNATSASGTITISDGDSSTAAQFMVQAGLEWRPLRRLALGLNGGLVYMTRLARRLPVVGGAIPADTTLQVHRLGGLLPSLGLSLALEL